MRYTCSTRIENGAPMLATSRAAATYQRKGEFRMDTSDSTPQPQVKQPVFVYFIAEYKLPASPIKIGITNDVMSRVRKLQTGHPTQLNILFVISTPTRAAAKRLEAFFHNRYREFLVRGEWYDISPMRVWEDLEFFVQISFLLDGARVQTAIHKDTLVRMDAEYSKLRQ